MSVERTIKIPVGAFNKMSPQFVDQFNRPMTITLPITFASSAPSIASVDSSGKITAVAAGSAVITATSGNMSCQLGVQVYVPVVSGLVV